MTPTTHALLIEGLRREGWPKPARKHPADKGGWTRGGITAKNWGAYRRLGRPATPSELNAITELDALDFYYERYVRLPGLESVPDDSLRALLVDWTFTSWSDDPIKALQQSLAARLLYDGPIDGVLGPKTKAALLMDRAPRQTYREVLAARIRFYLGLAFDDQVDAFLESHPTSQLQNARGWVNRCLEFLPMLLLALLASGCAPTRYVPTATHPTATEITALASVVEAAQSLRLPFALRVTPPIVHAGGAAWVKCYTPPWMGAGRVRYGIEGLRTSEHAIDRTENSLLVDHIPCGSHVASCIAQTGAGVARREQRIETPNADDCEGAR